MQKNEVGLLPYTIYKSNSKCNKNLKVRSILALTASVFSRQPSNLRGGNVYFVGLGLPFPNLYCCAWSRKDLVCWEPPSSQHSCFFFSRSAVSSLLPPSCAQMFNPLSFCEPPDRTLLCSVVEGFFCLLLIPSCLKTHSSLQLSLLFCSSWMRG